jgi:two-component system sensor histidine kinase CpxA
MRSLFLKIFLWFWSAMAITVIAFATVVANTQPQDENGWNIFEPGPPHPRGASEGRSNVQRSERRGNHRRGGPGPREIASIAAAVLETGGIQAGERYLARLEQTTAARAWLFDGNGAEILRRPPSSLTAPRGETAQNRLRELAQRAARSGELEAVPPGPLWMAAQRTSRNFGTSYVIAVTQVDNRNRPPRGGPGRILDWLLFAPIQTQLVRLSAALLTTGIVCFLLARHLTAPLFHLRGAAQRLTAGDLKARVGAGLPVRGDEFGMLARDFDAMAQRLESLVSAQNRLVADVSHELRSPLARLSVALGLVRETAGPDAKEDLDRIEREAERLNSLIGQLLTLSRLESGDQKPARETIDLEMLLEEICADAQFEARGRDRGVILSATTPCPTLGTDSLLRSALENVVRNATRYTPAGTNVEVELRKIENQNGGETAVLRVRDFGPGVPDAALSQLFQPFYRVEGARDRQSGGAGLGLAITEAAIVLHGGTATASNAPGGGLLVEIHLPLTT